jgi:branched-chain amino acid transport system permease protein
MDSSFFLQLTLNGVLMGGFFALMATGFSFVWRVTGVINLAHGEFLLGGTYLAWFLLNPTRPEDLIISSIHLSVIALVMFALALSAGLFINRFILGRAVRNPWFRRGFSYAAGTVVAVILYSVWSTRSFAPIDPFLAIPFIALLFFALGFVLQDALLNRLVEGNYLTMLLVTFGLKIILENLGRLLYGADPRTLNIDYAGAFWRIGGSSITITETRLFALLISVLMIGALALFLNGTRAGHAVRAAAQNKIAARLVGINIKQTYAVSLGLALALTGVAGAMLGTFQPFTPDSGSSWTLRAFAIVALGGLGRLGGVVIGGLTLGLIESYIGGYISTGWAIAAPFIVLVIALIVRPPQAQTSLSVDEV